MIIIILAVLSSLAYMAMVSLTVYAFLRLKKVSRMFAEMGHTVSKVFGIVSCMKIQKDFENIEKMQALLVQITENQQFEEAAKLKKHIDEQLEAAEEAVKRLNETFGGAKIEVFKVSKH